MKFIDKSTGTLFETMEEPLVAMCVEVNDCGKCCMYHVVPRGKSCYEYARNNPTETAIAMNYEIIEDENPKEKPHICEVLCVEVGEKFTFPYPNKVYDECFVQEDGTLWSRNSRTKDVNRIGAQAICWLINHVDTVQKLYTSTDDEATDNKNRWIIAEDGDGIVCPKCGTDFCVLVYQTDEFDYCPKCGVKLDKPVEPKLTIDEIAICRILGAKWVSRDESWPHTVKLWTEKPRTGIYGDNEKSYEGDAEIAQIDPNKFPSLNYGDCICVEELIHD